MTHEIALKEIKERFITERVRGYVTVKGGHERRPPVSKEEAEAAWTKAEASFVKVLKTDAEVRAKLGITDGGTAV